MLGLGRIYVEMEWHTLQLDWWLANRLEFSGSVALGLLEGSRGTIVLWKYAEVCGSSGTMRN